MDLLVILLIAACVIGFLVVRQRQRRAQLESAREADLAAVKRTADEDVTKFGEELQRLDSDVAGHDLGEAAHDDYQRALDSYEQSKESLAAVTQPDQITHVTKVLEDGRYSVACVKARLAGEPVPQRRAPCFFNPAHGPSATDVMWAPPGGREREVPVCAADVERVAEGAEPDIRTVMNGPQRVPYWQGGPAYAPWAQGYYGGYAMNGLLPGLLIGSMMSGGWGFDDGGFGGGDGGGDFGGDMGGDGGSFTEGLGDFGGDFGGF
ncbi:MAG: hypothetical protein GEU96_05925 [Propionibacteriales bacterium]|nr:hypothetical protein [Propionibacteriales bacterium]